MWNSNIFGLSVSSNYTWFGCLSVKVKSGVRGHVSIMYCYARLSIALEKFNRNGTICSLKKRKEKKKQLCLLSVSPSVVIPTRRSICTFPRRFQNRLFCLLFLLSRGSMAVGKLILFLVCDFCSPQLCCQAQCGLHCQLLKKRCFAPFRLFALMCLTFTLYHFRFRFSWQLDGDTASEMQVQ